MLNSLSYITASKNTFEFYGKESTNYSKIQNPYIDWAELVSGDIFDQTWESVEQFGSVISNYRKMNTFKIKLIYFQNLQYYPTVSPGGGIYYDTYSGSFWELLRKQIEKELENNTPGRLKCNDFYMDCFITKIEFDKPLDVNRTVEITLTIKPVVNYWYSESNYYFRASTATLGHGYPYDYPYNYKSTVSATRIPVLSEGPVRIDFYGPATNPYFIIDGNTYGVNTSISSGETITIDGRLKKVYKKDASNNITNVYSLRNTNGYIFKPVGVGNLSVVWDSNCDVNVNLYNKRGMPAWL